MKLVIFINISVAVAIAVCFTQLLISTINSQSVCEHRFTGFSGEALFRWRLTSVC